jgi:hypothetical protein
MKKLSVLVLIIGFHNIVCGQTRIDSLKQKQWILINDKIDGKKEINFVEYSKEKVDLNSMIWTFLDKGHIEYDYQSSENVEACIGVDFLDLDVDHSFWRYNSISETFTLTLKGGYASIDDFLLKADYSLALEIDEFGSQRIKFTPKNVVYYKDLTKLHRKKH